MLDFKTGDFIDLDFSATAGYHDLSDGTLYLQEQGDIFSFSNSGDYRSHKYTGKRLTFKPSAFGAIKAMAKSYPVTVEVIYPEIPQTDTVQILSRNPERLVDVGLVEECEISVDSLNTELSALYLATMLEELPL